MGLKEILHLIDRLKPDELAELSRHLTALRGLGPTKGAKGDCAWLTAGILVELRRRGLLSFSPSAADVRRLAPRYETDAVAVCTTLLRATEGRLKPHELIRFGSLAARALCDDLEGGPAPVSLKVALINVAQIPGAVDKAYPGYLENGWLGALVNRGSIKDRP
jgi:hypothetical protein